MTLKYQRLRAPKEDGQTLQVPPLKEFPQTFARNQEIIARHDFELAGKSISAIRAAARTTLTSLAFSYSSQYRDVEVPAEPNGYLLAGHQPTLFHPGVWYKNFMLHSLARQTDSVAVNLVVDNDHDGLRAIRVPTGSVTDPRVEFVKFDSKASNGPFETERLHTRKVFDSFAERVSLAIRPFIHKPLVARLWPYAMIALDSMNQPSMAIAAGRHRLEADFGVQTLEIPLSQICQTESFAYFAAELLSRANEFRNFYNGAVDDYRTLHRIRSTSHPVPQLEESDGWIELPFWIWPAKRMNQTQRRQLFVKPAADLLTISDHDSIEKTLEISRLPEQIYELESNGISLRTRALTTTMYSRLVLSDAFLHGIGGAKYDQLTDQIIRQFFAVDPPDFNTVTATCFLPIEFERADIGDLKRLWLRRRELRFHAERFGDPDDAAFMKLVETKRSHWNEMPANGSKKPWHDKMESINEQLRSGINLRETELEEEIEAMQEKLRVSRILGSREFSFCLYDQSLIEKLKN